MKDISIRLNTESINDAIKELRHLESDFVRKVDIFVRILANDGIQIALMEFRSSVGDSNKDGQFSLAYDDSENIKSATISLEGTDVLFVEFGAGIYYNPSDPPHAKTADYNYGVGTYPGQTHAFEPGWWYTDENGKSVYSHGTQATSPMLKASDNIRNNAIKTALQIFRS